MQTPIAGLEIHRRLQDAEAAWRSVAAAHPPYVFQSFDWLSLWHRTCAAMDQVEPFIVVATGHDGSPVALFPLGIRHRFRCRTLTFLGGDVTDYNAPLFHPAVRACLAEAGIAPLWREIVAMAEADLVDLTRMPESFADGTANPMVGEGHARHEGNAYAAASLPATFDAFVAGRSKVYFADTRRKRRKLARLGSVALHVAETPADIDAIVGLMLRQKQRRIAETNARPMPRQHEQFYRALAGSVIAGGRPHLSALHVNGTPVATHLGVVHQRRFYWLMPGYEVGEWARLSVGRALLQSAVEWCIDNAITTVDLTVGDEEYKRFWTDTRLRLFQSTYAVTLRGTGLLAAKRLRPGVLRKPVGTPSGTGPGWG